MLLAIMGCPNPPANFEILENDLIYSTRTVFDLPTMSETTVDLKMDVIGPNPSRKNPGPYPLLIFFHGNNPMTYRHDQHASYQHDHPYNARIRRFATEHGCVVATVDYIQSPFKLYDAAVNLNKVPLCPPSPGKLGLYDLIEGDRNWHYMARQGKEAICFLRARHQQFNFDPGNITVAGHSAGGAIAAMAGLNISCGHIPAFAQGQAPATYTDTSITVLWNALIDTMNAYLRTQYPHGNWTMPITLPRNDMGAYPDCQPVKNVMMLGTGLIDPSIMQPSGPRLMIYGGDGDRTLRGLNAAAQDPCVNARPFLIYSAIDSAARSRGLTPTLVQSSLPDEHYFDDDQFENAAVLFIGL